MKANIIFSTNYTIEKEYHPQPASKFIPEWYKNMDSYMGGKKQPIGNGQTSGTIKKCLPVFDAITAGYIITLPADIFVTQQNGAPYFEWTNFGLIEFHPVEQAPNYPKSTNFPYPKLMNPWAMQTPKGYSTLFVQPFHRESVFTIMPGIVDTDMYYAPVNFPFVLNDPKFEGLIPAGTPIAQVIPIKRNKWQMTQNKLNYDPIMRKMKTKMFDKYKTMFWAKKDYK